MNTFNFQRFRNVARWDLTINRTFYTRMSIEIVSIILAPMMMKYIYQLWIIIAGSGMRDAYITANTVDDVESLVAFTRFLIPLIQSVLMAYMFHNLVTRQGRINELTLPATNLERFLWHLCLVVGGGLLLFLCSFLLSDLLHVLLGWAILHQTSFQSYTVEMLKSYGELIEFWDSPGLFICVIITALTGYSFFALGSAWRYRYSIAYTMLYLLIIWLGSMIVMGFIISFIASSVDKQDFNQMLENWSVHSTGIIILMLTIQTAIFIFVWWLTYRLYCRAQITTRRNP